MHLLFMTIPWMDFFNQLNRSKEADLCPVDALLGLMSS